MIWFSLLVLIPLTAILVQASEGGWAAYWAALTSAQTAAALRLTVGHAFLVTAGQRRDGHRDRLGAGP